MCVSLVLLTLLTVLLFVRSVCGVPLKHYRRFCGEVLEVKDDPAGQVNIKDVCLKWCHLIA